MKNVLIVLLCFLSFQVFAQRGSYYLTNVNIIGKQFVDYHYKDGKDLYVATFKSDSKYATLEITKNKAHYFSVSRDNSGKPTYRLGKSEKLIGFNKKAYQILPQEIKLFLAYLAVDEREYHPQFNGGGETDLNTGIPSALGPDIAAAADGGDGECSQTGPCSCSNGQTVDVTCGCDYAITCDMREATICTSDADGYNRRCTTASRCVGRCAALH